jgi:hypothetical protein
VEQHLVKLYDLRDDREKTRLVQKATLVTKDYGLVPEHGLFGSSEWWRAVGEGVIPVVTVDGIISRVFMSGHNDWPEFEIDDGREKSRWTREGNDEMYKVGRRVRLKYVLQKPKKQWLRDMKHNEEVLEIWVSAE